MTEFVYINRKGKETVLHGPVVGIAFFGAGLMVFLGMVFVLMRFCVILFMSAILLLLDICAAMLGVEHRFITFKNADKKL